MIARMKRGAYLVNTARGEDSQARRRCSGRSRADTWPGMPVMSGFRSPRRAIIPGAQCPTKG